jgi:hypothetical protein
LGSTEALGGAGMLEGGGTGAVEGGAGALLEGGGTGALEIGAELFCAAAKPARKRAEAARENFIVIV